MQIKSVMAVALAVSACGGNGEGDDVSSTEQAVVGVQHISDAANPPGTPGFFILPPLADTTPTFTGVFNPGFKTRLRAQINDLDCTTFAVGAVHNTLTNVLVYQDTYKINTNVTTLGLVTGNCYRVIPQLDTKALGFRDIIVSNGVAPAGVRKFTPGSNFAITTRLEGNMDADGDGVLNHVDNCVNVPNANQADSNNNGVGDACEPVADADADGVPDATDNCVNVPNTNQLDTDADGTGDACDFCSLDPNKVGPGVCGCGTADVDSDGDGTLDCNDGCPLDVNKIAPGLCGCGTADTDTDGDGRPNCQETCTP